MVHRRTGGNVPMQSRKRLVWISIGTTFLFCLLIIQFYRIQIIEGDKWTKKAQAQHQLAIIEPFKRGTFYSNTTLKKGHPEGVKPLVSDVPKFHLFVDPKSIPDSVKPQISRKIVSILKLKEEDIKKISSHLAKNSRSRKVLMWMSREKRNALESWWFDFARSHKIPRNALFFIQDYKRSYPYGKLLGQVLHTVREDRDPKSPKNVVLVGEFQDD